MKIFITGASGYIGGSIAVALRARGHSVRGLTRSENAAKQLMGLGIEPIIGQLDDDQLLSQQAQLADAVINTANADHRGAVETFINALVNTSKIFLHTSGSSIVGDDVGGARPNSAIFSEDSLLVVDPRKQARRDIDLLVINAAQKKIRSSVIIPSLIYGTGTGLHQQSIQVPFLVENAQQQKSVQIVGKGLNVWSNVHIEDLVDLYILALESAPAGSFYFAENGEASFLEIAQAIADRLHMKEIEHLAPERAVDQWGMARALFSLGSNSRVRSVHARKFLGWAPRHTSVQYWITHEMTIS
jgi:nucleoside-diphosphate-sugar epimerase